MILDRSKKRKLSNGNVDNVSCNSSLNSSASFVSPHWETKLLKADLTESQSKVKLCFPERKVFWGFVWLQRSSRQIQIFLLCAPGSFRFDAWEINGTKKVVQINILFTIPDRSSEKGNRQTE